MKKILILLLGVLLFSSCLKEEIPFQYTVRVYVTNSGSDSIEDIMLKYLKDGRNDFPYTYNDMEKYYEFTKIINLGTYEVSVVKNGKLNRKDITLNDDTNKIIIVQL